MTVNNTYVLTTLREIELVNSLVKFYKRGVVMEQKFITSPFISVFTHMDSKYTLYSMLICKQIVINNVHLSILDYSKKGVLLRSLYYQFNKKDIEYLIRHRVLIEDVNIWSLSNVVVCEIEICSQCNYECTYCPNSRNKRNTQIMTLDLYKNVINRIVEHGTVKIVTFNLYNEPLLDPLWDNRIDMLSQTDLKLVLNTNGSKLKHEKIMSMKNLNIIHEIYFNIPSLDPNQYRELTGNGDLNHVMENVDECIRAGLNVTIVVNGLQNTQMINFQSIQHRYNKMENVKVFRWETTDRAGVLKNEYYQNIHIKTKFHGCKQLINFMQIDVQGRVLLCCNDYYKKYKFGNIENHSLQEILESSKYIEYKKMVFGYQPSDKKMLCASCSEMQKNNILVVF